MSPSVRRLLTNASSSDFSMSAKRSTISSNDVELALGELEFESFVEPCIQALKGMTGQAHSTVWQWLILTIAEYKEQKEQQKAAKGASKAGSTQ